MKGWISKVSKECGNSKASNNNFSVIYETALHKKSITCISILPDYGFSICWNFPPIIFVKKNNNNVYFFKYLPQQRYFSKFSFVSYEFFNKRPSLKENYIYAYIYA